MYSCSGYIIPCSKGKVKVYSGDATFIVTGTVLLTTSCCQKDRPRDNWIVFPFHLNRFRDTIVYLGLLYMIGWSKPCIRSRTAFPHEG